jgi:thiosulfate dehydrogenase [quinone] large subunit
MSVAHSPMDHLDTSSGKHAESVSTTTGAVTHGSVQLPTAARRVLAVLRIAFGLTFLWAFLDKTFALGFSTGRAENGTIDQFGSAAWIHGGSPTQGFLAFGADGPFKGFYNSIAGTPLADWGFMIALLAIGTALTFGAGMRLAAVAGGVLYVMMWSVALLPDTNPLIDDHILGALTIIALALVNAGDTWGLGRWWSKTDVVEQYPVLR